MSCANTNWPEYIMGNSGEKIPVSQKIHVQVGDTPRHVISYFRSSCYIAVWAKLPDTTDFRVKNYSQYYRLFWLADSTLKCNSVIASAAARLNSKTYRRAKASLLVDWRRWMSPILFSSRRRPLQPSGQDCRRSASSGARSFQRSPLVWCLNCLGIAGINQGIYQAVQLHCIVFKHF